MSTPVAQPKLRRAYNEALRAVWDDFDKHFDGSHPWKEDDLLYTVTQSGMTPVEKAMLMYNHGFVSGIAAAMGWSYQRPR